MSKNNQTLDILITISLTLAIISSFFILKNLHIGSIKLPQLFYFFVIISFISLSLKIRLSLEYKDSLKKIIKKYGIWIFIFFLFVSINIFFYLINYEVYKLYPSFLVDLFRVIIAIMVAITIILHLGLNKTAHKWLMIAFFTPLILSPLIFFRDIDKIIKMFSPEFFSNYSIQALQYNPTSLATWLVITFSFSLSFLFNKIKEKKTFHIFILSLTTIFTTSLIWWTNSRGALLASIIIFLILGFLFYKNKKIKLILIPIYLFIIYSISLLILPPQAKTSIFIRYYPQYRQEVVESNFIYNIVEEIEKEKHLSVPNLTNAQDRQNFWPKHIVYLINHPFGIYGPKFFSFSNIDTLHDGEHNTIMTAGKWGGWVSMTIITLFLFYIFKIITISIKKYSDNPYLLGLSMSYFGIFLLAMLNSFINLKTFWIIPAMIIAFTIQNSKNI